MTTGLQAALLAGALLGLGITLLIVRLLPAEPDLADALDRLSPHHASSAAAVTTTTAPSSLQDRLGAWALRSLPANLWGRTPTRELALLQKPVTRFYGEKLTFAGVGLVAPPLLALLFQTLDIGLPVAVPAVASLGLAVVLFFVPNYNAIDDARTARREFSRALSTYLELVALERNNGAGVRQAMEAAAAVGDSWVFTRLSEQLFRSRWSGLPPWDALHTLATELGLPELNDFADIMRLSGEEGTSVYATLRARAAAMRTAQVNEELSEANALGERMAIPGSLLGVIFMALLVAPALLHMFAVA